MLTWITENLATIIIGALLAVIVTVLIIRMVKDKKRGKSSCGCGCNSCPLADKCCSTDCKR